MLLTCVLILLASIAGFAYALWPQKDLGSFGYAGAPTAQSVNVQRQDSRALGEHYGNGQIPLLELQQISKGHFLVPAAAEEFERLQAGLRAAGHDLKINSSYRTLAEQEGLIKRYGLLESGGTAAPAGQSDHGLGLSVDVKLDGNALRWMSDNAARYGFENTVTGEPWHWTFTG
ncbi:D-alanyl-D-alanine carboxypeptidase family protein [Arthrobacter sp. MYb227]|uniref:M15 family metallopeptidase n=1 Tax=Arthrobacter sp. MYb227 TaxID=1848601 RepID=UPI0015E2F4C4|nr:D-alanyl-D-alanine carboxypeptidase family protein [Arthrobacter sp. MYb227]